uniref:Haloacid dehalogenase like hydrolase domain containing 5 n=1 Tax=Anser brachyrhynchus TaxID=132585 RepID=A0A8B9BWX3_9AVES
VRHVKCVTGLNSGIILFSNNFTSAVVLFGEPVRWETNLQLIIDVLLTSGYPGNPYHHENYPHIPVLACNMDLMWVAEAQSPRDNLMTDVYGANLYNRYLEEKNSRKGSKTQIQNELASAAATHCRSVLVCTGVYNPHTEAPLDTKESITETVFHGHRDFRFDPGLVEPDHIVPDVDAAVDLIFHLENFAPN